MTTVQRSARPRILCLSGGGLRATYFHLGVLRSLRKQGLLDNTQHVVSVSGGSILAAHMFMNWGRYLGSGDDFRGVQTEVLRYRNIDIRGRALRRSILSFPITAWNLLVPKLPLYQTGTSDFLQREYERLYRSHHFTGPVSHELDDPPPGLRYPRFHILATNLRSGRMVSFSQSRYEHGPGDDAQVFANLIPLHQAVAASSCFPPVFTPRDVTGEMLGFEEGTLPDDPHRLTDGGVYDNTGFEKAVEICNQNPGIKYDIVVSDAGSPFRSNPNRTYAIFTSLASRAVDVLMSRVAQKVTETMRSEDFANNVTVISINDTKALLPEEGEDYDLPVAFEAIRQFGYVRTDLDKFSQPEVAGLVWFGEAMADRKLQDTYGTIGGDPTARDVGPLPYPLPAKKELSDAIKKASRRKMGLINTRDWTSAVIMLFPLIVLSWLAQTTIYTRIKVPELATKRATEIQNLESQVAALKTQLRSASSIESVLTSSQITTTVLKDCRLKVADAVSQEIQRRSGFIGGGHSQKEWCDTLAVQVKSENPGARVTPLYDKASEEPRDGCRPFRCMTYNYSCVVKLEREPQYKMQRLSICPP